MAQLLLVLLLIASYTAWVFAVDHLAESPRFSVRHILIAMAVVATLLADSHGHFANDK
jgi:hypothetical protein